jgi:5'-nucleotidase
MSKDQIEQIDQIAALTRRIVIVNDDGVQSRGLALLERVATRFGGEVFVVAPDDERSGASQSISLSLPLRVRRLDARRFAVKGTPADCVMVAIAALLKDGPPSLVLSGVNHGENLADDLAYSGTSGAAMEAAQFGIPAIAFSQLRELGQIPNFDVAERHLEPVLRKLLGVQWHEGLAFNVNFPAVPGGEVSGIEMAPAGRRARRPFFPVEGKDGRNVPYYWVGIDYARELEPAPGTDLAVVRKKAISVTPLRRDPTDHHTLDRLGRLFES